MPDTVHTNCWIVKLDTLGNIQWQNYYGGTGYDEPNGIKQTADSGFIFVATTSSNDYDVSGLHNPSLYSFDTWVVKLDKTGVIQWQKCIGGSLNENAQAVTGTRDGNCIVASNARSIDGDVTANHGPAFTNDLLLTKLSPLNGTAIWTKCIGGTDDDHFGALIENPDSTLMLGAWNANMTGDFAGLTRCCDYSLLKLDKNGDNLWAKNYGGNQTDVLSCITPSLGGGYLLSGSSRSGNGNVQLNYAGSRDLWLLKVDDTGGIQWQKTLGGTDNDSWPVTIQDIDCSYIVSGFSNSQDHDLSPGTNGDYDVCVFKLGKYPLGVSSISNTDKIKVYPTFSHGSVYIELPESFFDANIRVMTIDGKNVSAQPMVISHGKIRLDGLPAGVDVIIIRKGGEVLTKMVIVD